MSIVTSLADITGQMSVPASLSINSAALAKGIDNYHADVELSAAFTLRVKESIDTNLKRLIAGKQIESGNTEAIVELRNAYSDLMKVTLHRTKTDLGPDQITVLQFALIKFVIQEVRDALDRYSDQLEETLGQQQYAGSRSLLTTQEKVTWYRKHSNEFMFRLTRLYLRAIQREENNQLKTLREQILGDFPEAANVMLNPLLYARSPKETLLLLDYYAIWPGNDFEAVNQAVETVLTKQLPDEPFEALKSTEKLSAAQAEVYDELGGLFAAQNLLGPSADQKESVSEVFSWLEHPGNIRLLFDAKQHERFLKAAKEDGGFSAGWGLKGDLKKLQKISAELKKAVGDNKTLKLSLASYSLREKLTQPDLDMIDIEDALALVAGQDNRKIADVVDHTLDGAAVLVTKLEECAKDFDMRFREASDELFLRLLTDVARYRMHLKYYRFAHRMFNRVTVITDPEKIQLAKAGGNLYRLLASDEVKEAVAEDDQPEIVHHAILKADVRGSTVVTSELMKQGLNPASYFSLRFFNPITEKLSQYGAVKVFIEGDAVILGVYEYDNSPDQWFAVARSCGIAKEMLDIVTSKNADSKQTGLPSLEIGIGICYADERPLFLFDENRPIMISGAIGDADRMSACSWGLRKTFDGGNFRVHALAIAEGERQHGEKGQELIRYNVNGISIDGASFEKLKNEVHFKKLKAKAGDRSETFYVGQYPDVVGKQRDLVVREGKVGLWSSAGVDLDAETGLVFHEVLPNGKFANQIVELSRKK